MPRPNKNFEPKKEALAKLAFDLFIEQGYENTTITQIMKAAGITKAGMYHYFSSKEDILDAAINYGASRDAEKMREDMSLLRAEEKMIFLIKGNNVQNVFLQKLTQLKRHNQDSYAAYRIRERLVHVYIPIMEDVLREGIEQGVYKTQYPRQTAEILVLCSRALVESNFLPAASAEDMQLRLKTFFLMMKQWLNPGPQHAEEIMALIDSIVNRIHVTG